MNASTSIVLDRVVVRRGRMLLETRIPEGSPLRTNPDIAAFAIKVHPTLIRHSCINRNGPTFGEVIDDTPIAHLFEHLIIAEQTALYDSQSATFVGTTERTGERTYRTEVSFRDDLVALQAVNISLEVLNRIIEEVSNG